VIANKFLWKGHSTSAYTSTFLTS